MWNIHRRHQHLVLAVVTALLLLSVSNCLRFEMTAMPDTGNKFSVASIKNMPGSKCLSLFIGPHVLVTGSVEVSQGFQMKTLALISDNAGNQHWSKADLDADTKNKFSFRTHNVAMDYDVCFYTMLLPGYQSNPNLTREIILELVTGLDLFDDEKASELKVKPLEREIIRLEGMVAGIVNELNENIGTEMSLRDINESTSDRVKWLSIFSILTLIGMGVWQLWYLKRFFKAKKLI